MPLLHKPSSLVLIKWTLIYILFLLQLCPFTVSYEQSAITYVWKNDEDTLRKSPSLTTLNAYLIQNQTIACEIKGSWRGLLNAIDNTIILSSIKNAIYLYKKRDLKYKILNST